MSKKKAREICKNLHKTIKGMTPSKVIYNAGMFDDKPARASKSVLKRIYNNLIKKYGFRRRQL